MRHGSNLKVSPNTWKNGGTAFTGFSLATKGVPSESWITPWPSHDTMDGVRTRSGFSLV